MSLCQLASEDNRVDSSFIGPRMRTGTVWCQDLSWISKLLAVDSFQLHRRTKGFFNFHCIHVEQQFVNKKTIISQEWMTTPGHKLQLPAMHSSSCGRSYISSQSPKERECRKQRLEKVLALQPWGLKLESPATTEKSRHSHPCLCP